MLNSFRVLFYLLHLLRLSIFYSNRATPVTERNSRCGHSDFGIRENIFHDTKFDRETSNIIWHIFVHRILNDFDFPISYRGQ